MRLPRFGPIASGLADPATLSGDDVPVAVADYHALQSLFGAPQAVTLPEVPGVHAWVVFNPQVGRQLWVDSRFCPPSLHRRVWEAAFGSLPPGYVVQPFGDPGSQPVA